MTGIWSKCSGRLGSDAKHQMVKGGTMNMTKFSVAVTMDQAGATQWLNVTAFKDLAKETSGWLKGELVTVEGWLKLDQWTAPDGAPRCGLSMVANVANVGGARRDRSEQQRDIGQQPRPSGPGAGGGRDYARP